MSIRRRSGARCRLCGKFQHKHDLKRTYQGWSCNDKFDTVACAERRFGKKAAPSEAEEEFSDENQ